MGNAREQEILGLGFVPGEVHYTAGQSGSPYGFLRDDLRIPTANLHTTLVDSYSAAGVQNGNNNVIVVSPDSHSQAAALTLSKNMTHLVGAYPAALMGQRSRIGHSADFDALLILSGYGNLLKNLLIQHGRGSATNLHAVEITGDRNKLENVQIAGPLHATEAGTAGYSCLELTGTEESYFKNCVFGADTIARSAANSVLRLGAQSVRNIFEDCIFLMSASAATPYFIEVLVGVTYGWSLFKRCQFINTGTSLTVGILNSSASYGHKLIFTPDCFMAGVTDVIAAAGEASVLIGTAPWASADKLFNMLTVNPDVS